VLELERLQTPWVMAAAAVVLLLVVALGLFLYKRSRSDERRIRKTIARHTSEVIRDAVIPDGIDGYLFADYLLRLGGNIIVLNCESRRGYIFGAGNIEEWTGVENNRTEKFRNPMRRATLFAQQIIHTCDFDAVIPCVLFGSDSQFPKGIPEGVIPIEQFDAQLESLAEGNGSGESLEEAWAKLTALTHEGRHQINAAL